MRKIAFHVKYAVNSNKVYALSEQFLKENNAVGMEIIGQRKHGNEPVACNLYPGSF